MIIAVDIGNTNIDIAVFDFDESVNSKNIDMHLKNISPVLKFQISALDFKSTDEYTLIIYNLLKINQLNIDLIEACIIASVVPRITKLIYSALKKISSSFIYTVGVGIKTGLNINIDSNAQLGSDIVANAVAALAMHNAPIAVVDFGTATTISVIDDKKNLSGVIIMPGVELALNSLAHGTAMLNQINLDTKKVPLIGKNSEESIKSGVINSLAFSTDEFINRIKSDFNFRNLTVVSTGDFAEYIIENCKTEIISCENLTLLGLVKIYFLNRKWRYYVFYT